MFQGKIEIETNSLIEPGTIYLIPRFIRCKYCQHEISIGTAKLTGMIDCTGGCNKRSSIVDYAKYFGVIKL